MLLLFRAERAVLFFEGPRQLPVEAVPVVNQSPQLVVGIHA